MTEKVKIAVLCSGGGTNLQAVLEAERAGKIPDGEVVLVLSDRRDAYALERAARYHVRGLAFEKREFTPEALEDAMLFELEKEGIGLVVLAGFLTVLSARFVGRFEGRILNIHPSLLPSFGGVGMYGLRVHEAALARGVKVTGATVHFVTEECDGGPIIAQKAVEVREGDTPESLQQRVMREAEWVIYPEAVETVCRGLLHS